MNFLVIRSYLYYVKTIFISVPYIYYEIRWELLKSNPKKNGT